MISDGHKSLSGICVGIYVVVYSLYISHCEGDCVALKRSLKRESNTRSFAELRS